MNKRIASEIRKLKKEREVLTEFIRRLDKWVIGKQITLQERDEHIQRLTGGSTIKSYIQDINRNISELEEQPSKPNEQNFLYAKPIVVSASIMMIFLIGFYAFLGPTMTGLFALENVKEYDLSIAETFSEDSVYALDITGFTNNTQNITSMHLVGNYYGEFAVYLISDAGSGKESYRIYSSGDIGSLSTITGFVTGEETDIGIPEILLPDITPDEEIQEQTPSMTEDETTEESITEETLSEEPSSIPADNPTDNYAEEQTDVMPEQESPVEKANETPGETSEIPEEVIYDISEETIEEIVPETKEDIPEIISFNKECIETCDIELSPEGLSIYVELEDNSSLTIDKIIFSQRTAPIIEEIVNETLINETIILNETINLTLINETLINETIINETIINETINQTMDIAKIDPELLNEFNSKEKVRVLIKKNGELQTVYIAQKDVPKEKKNRPISTQSEEISSEEIKTRYSMAKDMTDEQLKGYEGKKLLDKNTRKPVEIEQETIDVLASTMDMAQLTELSLIPEVEFMTIDKEFSALTTESMNITRIIDAQQLGYSGEGINVCVLDTGYSGQASSGYNFVDDNEDYSDNNGHGTKVVYPLIASAPGINLVIAKVISDSGIGYASDIIAGIEYCQLQNASIISASIGGGGFDGYCDEDIVASKINYIAENDNILTIASTGNDGNNQVKSPACARNALAVASSTKNSILASFSNYGGATLLLAPGENIQTVDNNGNPSAESGTSMSVPFVTATAAMILQNGSLTANDTKWRIIHTGEIIEQPVTGLENNFRRFSLLNAYNALTNNITNNLTEENVFIAYGETKNFTTSVVTSYYDAGSASSDCSNGGGNGWTKLPDIISLDDAYAETDTIWNNNMYDWEVYLVKGYSAVGTNQYTFTLLDTAESGFTFGSSTNLWGTTLTPADVESSSFGAAISFYDMDIDDFTCFIITDSHGIDVPAGAQIRGVELYTEYFFDDKAALVKVDGMQLRVYYDYAISTKGNAYSWSWSAVTALDSGTKLPSGNPYNWSWLSPSSGSGRMIRNGTAYNWNWVPE